MKIYINPIEYIGGPKNFCNRLHLELSKRKNIQFVKYPLKADISLCFIFAPKRKKGPVITRLDGCYWQKKDRLRNKSLVESIVKSDHVIYQSMFSKNMCEDILGIKKEESSIIYNGANNIEIESIRKNSKVKPDSFCIVSTNKIKRVDLALDSYINTGLSNNIYVVGHTREIDLNKYKKHKNIIFMDKVPPHMAMSTMKACRYQMHLSFIDSCPNSVIEGLLCGNNILCSNLGGTREIVKDNGVIVDIDANWDNDDKWKYIDYDYSYDKDMIDKVSNGIIDLMKIDSVPVRKDLYISNVADKYINLMNRVLNKK